MKIDAIGLVCPEPIMLLHKAIHESDSGQIIELIATDPAAKKDVEKFCEFLDHKLVSFKKEKDQFIFQIKKK
jgi:tRNA 2-thiouridine synthesizing protein A|tara:strand:+ start:304 stop:519 length:216 start_codon:yes stop_codon:yes gene_type:complete